MRENKFLDGVSNIESDVVERFVSMDNQLQKKASKSKFKNAWLRIGAIAACFVLIVSAAIVVPMLRDSGDNPINKPPTISTPNVVITFDSVTDIIEFISAANSQETQFSEYAEKHSISKNVTYDVAKIFAKNCSKTQVFCNKSNVVCDSFSGTYYTERNELSLIYKINGISYRFIYNFGAHTPYEYDSAPVLHDANVGPFVLDLYQGDGRLVGSVIDGETAIRIIVKAEQISDIDFELFTIISN